MIQVKQESDNLGGVSRLVAIAPSAFRRVRRDYVSGYNYLEVIPTDDVIDIPDSFFTHTVDEKRSVTDDGYMYRVECVGKMVRCPQNEEIADRLQRGQWMVLSVDSLGGGRLFGEKEQLLFFESDSSTGTAAGDSSRISFNFTGELPKRGVDLRPFTSDYI